MRFRAYYSIAGADSIVVFHQIGTHPALNVVSVEPKKPTVSKYASFLCLTEVMPD